ncbi:glycosyltransferase family 15 protein [Sphaerobolus stellatus SS14]|uniref:Glycosyltransferase family 15 protein n=1 Tax=Sphaerobolus stellatus (strain SS14) TaxID=990650 RepID=A0A0C9UEM1_SPHS4|nr:glycosyltransferase family 15 protein [Sphaerobolus stellatus SS14]
MVLLGAKMKFQWKDPEKALAGRRLDEVAVLYLTSKRLGKRPLHCVLRPSGKGRRCVVSIRITRSPSLAPTFATGFFYERWGDALVHSYYAAMVFHPEQVMQLTDIRYQHDNMRHMPVVGSLHVRP